VNFALSSQQELLKNEGRQFLDTECLFMALTNNLVQTIDILQDHLLSLNTSMPFPGQQVNQVKPECTLQPNVQLARIAPLVPVVQEIFVYWPNSSISKPCVDLG
jgi:hypothetical protein